MSCSQNAFCRRLSVKTRRELCEHCNRRLFKAGSVQSYGDFRQTGLLVLDGVLVARATEGDFLFEGYEPAFYIGFPGFFGNLDVNLGFNDKDEVFQHLDIEYLTDAQVAIFDHRAVSDLYDSNHEFSNAVVWSLHKSAQTAMQFTAMLRANYTYQGLLHLLRMLGENGQYLTHKQLAGVMNRDRTSISKAVSRIKKEYPEIWESYAKGKGKTSSLLSCQ